MEINPVFPVEFPKRSYIIRVSVTTQSLARYCSAFLKGCSGRNFNRKLKEPPTIRLRVSDMRSYGGKKNTPLLNRPVLGTILSRTAETYDWMKYMLDEPCCVRSLGITTPHLVRAYNYQQTALPAHSGLMKLTNSVILHHILYSTRVKNTFSTVYSWNWNKSVEGKTMHVCNSSKGLFARWEINEITNNKLQDLVRVGTETQR
jgi:hypothetical protein